MKKTNISTSTTSSRRPFSGPSFQDFKQNRPLTNLSLALNFYFGQLDPFGYHIVNFIFFFLTGLGIWLLLNRLFIRLGYDPARSEIAAWLSALLWVSHPLNTQAVTYIVQRHVSFAGAFSIWSIYFFHLGMEAKKRRLMLYSLCAIWAICALLCKETALTLPAIILLYKIYFFDELKPGWMRINAKWVIALAVFYALASLAALRPVMIDHLRHEFMSNHVSAWGKFISAPRPLFWYLYLIAFPFPQFMSLIHEFPISAGFFHPFTTAVSWLGFLAAVFIAIAMARSLKIFSFAVLWYLGSLAVESMPLPIDLVNEHRLYLAMLSVLVPACAWPAVKGKNLNMAIPWAMLVAIFFGFFTFSRNLVWINDIALWRDVHLKFPQYANAYNELGFAYVNQGRYDRALQDLNKAIEIDPANAFAYNNRGILFKSRGLLDLAMQDFNKAIELDPGYAKALYHRALIYAARGRPDLAIRDCSYAIELDPQFAEACFFCGNVHLDKGQLDLAIRDLSKAIELNPRYAYAYNNRGAAYAAKGQLDLAMKDFNQAIELDPKYVRPYVGRGGIFSARGQLDLAMKDFNKAIELNPNYAQAYYNRGLLYKTKGQLELAQKDFQKAAELDPKFARTQP